MPPASVATRPCGSCVNSCPRNRRCSPPTSARSTPPPPAQPGSSGRSWPPKVTLSSSPPKPGRGPPGLAQRSTSVRAAAGRALQRRSEAWQPMATAPCRLGWTWPAPASAPPPISAGAQAGGGVAQDRRPARCATTRLAPFATTVGQVWETAAPGEQRRARPRSGCEGSGEPPPGRASTSPIDGVAGAALGVMSQGELHALALALFLPRATLPESPFRFVVIDDPVQSMDPAQGRRARPGARRQSPQPGR